MISKKFVHEIFNISICARKKIFRKLLTFDTFTLILLYENNREIIKQNN